MTNLKRWQILLPLLFLITVTILYWDYVAPVETNTTTTKVMMNRTHEAKEYEILVLKKSIQNAENAARDANVAKEEAEKAARDAEKAKKEAEKEFAEFRLNVAETANDRLKNNKEESVVFKEDDGGCIGKASRQGMVKPRNWGSSRSNTGNTFRLHNILQHQNNTDVKVLIMGGSMTAGHEVGSIKDAWPAMLGNMIEFSGLKITNRAQASTGTIWFLQNLGTQLAPFDWDIIMIEAAMNDDDVCNGCRYSSESEVTTNFEQLVRGILLLLPQTAIIIVEAFRQSKAPRNGFTSGQNQHDIISKYYELPVISIRDAIWHDYDEDIRRNRETLLTMAFPRTGIDKQKYWSGSHPSRIGHQLITDIIAHELCRFQKETPSLEYGRELLPPLLIKNDINITRHWLHSYQFESLGYKAYSDIDLHTKGWGYVVQQSKSGNSKPGLMCNNTQPNYATFNVVGCKSTFYISFMKSYSTFGTASVVFNGTENGNESTSILLKSRWDISKGSARSPEVTRFKNAKFSTLTISLLPDKDNEKHAFKLLEVRCV